MAHETNILQTKIITELQRAPLSLKLPIIVDASVLTHFNGSLLRSIRLERAGPTCTLRLDLPNKGNDYVQIHLAMFAVENVLLKSSLHLPGQVEFMLKTLPHHRVMLEIVSGPMKFSLSSADQLHITKVSMHYAADSMIDTGEHQFTSAIDKRLYNKIPSPEVDTYYGNF